MDIKIEIARRISAARLQRGLTQLDLAEKFNKSSAANSAIERGKTKISAFDLVLFSEIVSKPLGFFC